MNKKKLIGAVLGSLTLATPALAEESAQTTPHADTTPAEDTGGDQACKAITVEFDMGGDQACKTVTVEFDTGGDQACKTVTVEPGAGSENACAASKGVIRHPKTGVPLHKK